jgi:hypothetical protein
MAPSCAVFAFGWVRGPGRDTAARPQTACEADMSLSGFDLLTELGGYPRRVQTMEHQAEQELSRRHTLWPFGSGETRQMGTARCCERQVGIFREFDHLVSVISICPWQLART